MTHTNRSFALAFAFAFAAMLSLWVPTLAPVQAQPAHGAMLATLA